jgi:transcriptional regulator with XRE-family HTH domain
MDELDRIKKIMQTEELNSAQFAAEIGIQGSTLSHILNGRNNPSLDVHKKILNRFRTVSSDWLILGIGSMYRSEKQSQAPTLFDSVDESSSKSAISEQISAEKKDSTFSPIQQKTQQTQENLIQAPQEIIQSTFQAPIEVASKSVRKIIVYYTDNTFQEFESK